MIASGFTALVIAGGDTLPRLGGLPTYQLAVAADGGLDHARSLGISLDLVVGDLDSASDSSIEWARRQGVEISQHPTDKDATDLELAIGAAVERGARSLIVVGGRGGRLDHLAANLALLASERWSGVDIVWPGSDGNVTVVRGQTELRSEWGTSVTLLAVGGRATGINTDGLRWELEAATLDPGSTRGVSNEMTQGRATVSVERGVLLAIQSK